MGEVGGKSSKKGIARRGVDALSHFSGGKGPRQGALGRKEDGKNGRNSNVQKKRTTDKLRPRTRNESDLGKAWGAPHYFIYESRGAGPLGT